MMPKRVAKREPTGKQLSSAATKLRAKPTSSIGSPSRKTSARASSGSSAKRSSANAPSRRIPELCADFVDLLSALSDEKARFLVIGGYAVGVHGHPRATKDLDVWIDPTPTNARRVLEALRSFGAPIRGLTEPDLVNPEVVFQVGLPPNRIDILSAIAGVDFASCWKRRERVSFSGIRTPVISMVDLIQNKRATGRLQDLADADALVRLDSSSGARAR